MATWQKSTLQESIENPGLFPAAMALLQLHHLQKKRFPPQKGDQTRELLPVLCRAIHPTRAGALLHRESQCQLPSAGCLAGSRCQELLLRSRVQFDELAKYPLDTKPVLLFPRQKSPPGVQKKRFPPQKGGQTRELLPVLCRAIHPTRAGALLHRESQYQLPSAGCLAGSRCQELRARCLLRWPA